MPPGHARDHPHARFGGGLARHAEGRAARLVHRHALRREFVPSQQRVDALAGVAVLLEPRRVVAPLMVEHDDMRAAADLFEVAEGIRLRGYGAAVHARPDAIRPARGLRGAVVELPEFGAPRVVPHDPLAVDGVVPVGAQWNRLSGLRLELALAVIAVADTVAAHSRPTVIGDALGMGALDDLAQDVGQILVVVRAVDARDVLVGGAVGLAVGHAREPVGVGLIEILRGAVGVHARHDDQPVVDARPWSVRRRDRGR